MTNIGLFMRSVAVQIANFAIKQLKCMTQCVTNGVQLPKDLPVTDSIAHVYLLKIVTSIFLVDMKKLTLQWKFLTLINKISQRQVATLLFYNFKHQIYHQIYYLISLVFKAK